MVRDLRTHAQSVVGELARFESRSGPGEAPAAGPASVEPG